MQTVVTLTMNPALDKSASVSHVAPEIKMRCYDVAYDPGGGGINVSRAVMNMGGASTAVFPIGGGNGDLLLSLVEEQGVSARTVPVSGMTRDNFTAFDEASGMQFRFNAPGAAMSDDESASVLALIEGLSPAYLVASGSLPPGVPDDFYTQVAELAKSMGARLVLDTSGDPLRASLKSGGIYLLKPNMRELEQLYGDRIANEQEQEAAAMRLVTEGIAELVAVSLGAAGVLYATADNGVGRMRAPTVPIRSKVGAGDSMVAGMVYALANDMPTLEAIRYGVAAGSAAVMTDGTQLCRGEDVKRLYAKLVNGDTGQP